MSLRGLLGRFVYVGLMGSMLVLAARADSNSAPAQASKKPAQTPAKSVKQPIHKKAVTSAHHKRSSHAKASWRRGQQTIRPDRAQEIQDALVREHYLKGEPSGVWDSATQTAMQRYQADHGWQTKTVPDSRALIGLGLGPDHEHLLNPESAMTSTPKTENDPPGNETKKTIMNRRSSDPDAATNTAVPETEQSAPAQPASTQPSSTQPNSTQQ